MRHRERARTDAWEAYCLDLAIGLPPWILSMSVGYAPVMSLSGSQRGLGTVNAPWAGSLSSSGASTRLP